MWIYTFYVWVVVLDVDTYILCLGGCLRRGYIHFMFAWLS